MTTKSGRPGSNRPPEAWKATALPNELLPLLILLFQKTSTLFLKWAVVDSNHRSRRQRIYSPLHLATLVTARSYLQLAICNLKSNNSYSLPIAYCLLIRASGGIRTPDQLITNQLLWPTELHWQLPQIHTCNELSPNICIPI